VEILDFVRPERKFADVADLTRQISADVDFVWSLK
jgi:FAD synthase